MRNYDTKHGTTLSSSQRVSALNIFYTHTIFWAKSSQSVLFPSIQNGTHSTKWSAI